VITAILTDADARAADTSPNFDGGHLREPMLYMTNVMRGLGFVNNDAKAGNDVIANASYNTVGNYTSPLGERPYTSGSVFNFFPPSYVIPGTTLNAPEFGQENTATAQALLQFDSGLALVQADNTITSNAYNYAKVLTAATSSVPALQTVLPAANGLASQLKQIAQIIQVRGALGVSRQIFFAGIGNFDTHSDQVAQQGTLLA
jgi:hypothetical protein